MKWIAFTVSGIALVGLAATGCSSSQEAEGSSSSKVTAGAKAQFCPKDPVTRRDMARFLERMKNGASFNPPPGTGIFYKDVARGSDDERWIEALAGDRITRGCGEEGRYCPDDGVLREQMAAFIMRLQHGPDFTRGGASRFVDMTGDSEQFAGYVEQLADDGITTGCDETHFCPKRVVNREEMAAFLMRARHPGADPGGSGTFGDVAGDSQFMGRIEQATTEGIMEPCVLAGAPDPQKAPQPVPGWGLPAVVELRPTDAYGLDTTTVHKYFGNATLKNDCGGDYSIAVVAEIGRVGWDEIELRSVNVFYPGNRYPTQPDVAIDVYSNGTPDVHVGNGFLEIDENGTPFQRFWVGTTFTGVRPDQGGGLVFQHNVSPAAEYVDMDGAGQGLCGMTAKVVYQVVD